MNQIRLSPDAKAFVAAEAGRLRRQNHFAALRFKANILHIHDFSDQQPDPDPENMFSDMPRVRRGLIGDYVFFYQVSKDMTDILTIRSGHNEG